MKLYGYWRSSASYRVRIALNLKGLIYEDAFVSLVKDGGENRKPEFLGINPQGKIPVLETDSGEALTQSLAIIGYLDTIHPEPALLPADPFEAARARAFALAIACDIHPLNNSKVMGYLKTAMGHHDTAVKQWYQHWVVDGFSALEESLKRSDWSGPYVFGDQITIADIVLVPQVYNARRFDVDMSAFPRLAAIDTACLALPAFANAAPEAQGDAA